MSVEHIGKGYVKICVSEEELENSIAGLSQLKPILQTQVMKGKISLSFRGWAVRCLPSIFLRFS